MKKIIILLALLLSFNASSQIVDLSKKEYKKIAKKLDLKILNKKFDGSGKIWVKVNNTSSARPNIYTKYWNEVLFEMDIETGQITEQSESNITIDADWIFLIDGSGGTNSQTGRKYVCCGGFSGKILDFRNDSKVVGTFSTEEKMNFTNQIGGVNKRSVKFKNFVKVIVNEIFKTTK